MRSIAFLFATLAATSLSANAQQCPDTPYPGDQPITRERIVIARKWPQFYGGLSAFRMDSNYLFSASLLSPEYTAADVCAPGNALCGSSVPRT